MEFLLCLQTLAVTDDTVLEEHHEDPCLIQMRLLDDGGEFFFSFIDWTGISWRLLLMKSTIYRYIIEVASVAIVILMSNSLIDRGGISMISGRMLWMTNTYIYRGGFSGTLLLMTSTLHQGPIAFDDEHIYRHIAFDGKKIHLVVAALEGCF